MLQLMEASWLTNLDEKNLILKTNGYFIGCGRCMWQWNCVEMFWRFDGAPQMVLEIGNMYQRQNGVIGGNLSVYSPQRGLDGTMALEAVSGVRNVV